MMGCDSPLFLYFHAWTKTLASADDTTTRHVAAAAERLCTMPPNPRRLGVDKFANVLAWLSLAASFEGADDDFIEQLNGASEGHRRAVTRACLLVMTHVGDSSAF